MGVGSRRARVGRGRGPKLIWTTTKRITVETDLIPTRKLRGILRTSISNKKNKRRSPSNKKL